MIEISWITLFLIWILSGSFFPFYKHFEVFRCDVFHFNHFKRIFIGWFSNWYSIRAFFFTALYFSQWFKFLFKLINLNVFSFFRFFFWVQPHEIRDRIMNVQNELQFCKSKVRIGRTNQNYYRKPSNDFLFLGFVWIR